MTETFKRKSLDNITVVVVCFNNFTKVKKEGEKCKKGEYNEYFKKSSPLKPVQTSPLRKIY